jgi:hypothetical protein
MKEIKIPFSLTEYQKGGYEVETRGSEVYPPYKARILCTDFMSEGKTIVTANKHYGSFESICTYYEDGKFNENTDDIRDLFLVKREFEDGDIIHFLYDDDETAILKKCEGEYTYIYFCYNDRNWTIGYNKRIVGDFRIATEEEKQTLFDALAKNGKLWNPETKQIENINHRCDLKPKDWCLMSCGGYNEWVLCQFSNIKDLGYIAIGGKYFTECIPYNEETKDLLGTANDCPEKYKNIAL